jgi:hypothetical protein
LVSEETSGALLMGLGGALLIYVIAGLQFTLKSYTGDIGVVVYYFTFIGFLAFLFMGYGLFIIIRAATSPAQRSRRER